MKKSPCEFQLIGGLGNQLFIVLAATQHMLSGYPTIINTGNLHIYGENHGNSVESLEFPFETPLFVNKNSNLASMHFRATAYFMRSFKMNNFRRWRIESEVGYSDISHHKGRAGIKHLGYYQSSNFFTSELKSKLEFIDVSKPTKQFEDLVSEARERCPLMIHIRRGDYLSHAHDLGVLSMEYYENAFAKVKSIVESISDTWIFSEDYELGVELGNKLHSPYRVISSELGITDVETIVLLKYGGAHIVANSTFSWWGAFISSNSKCVLAPMPWFKNRITPNKLVPDNWINEKSLWL